MTTPGTSGSPGREHNRWKRFQETTGIRTSWELALSLAGALLIVGFLGWGIKGWVEMQFQAAAVIADRSQFGSLTGLVPGGSTQGFG